jgi:hypothetical protein
MTLPSHSSRFYHPHNSGRSSTDHGADHLCFISPVFTSWRSELATAVVFSFLTDTWHLPPLGPTVNFVPFSTNNLTFSCQFPSSRAPKYDTVKFTLQQATKAQRWSRGVALLFL